MFDIGWGELVVIGIVALIVIGPRELPKTLRTVGQMMTKVRRMAAEFQGQFNEAIREAELDELRKEAEKLTKVTDKIADPVGSFNPLETIRSEVKAAVEGTEKPEAKDAPARIEPPAEKDAPADAPADGGGRAA